MTRPDLALRGDYFDGRTGLRHAVELTQPAPGSLAVQGDGIDRREALAELCITPRLARTSRTIAFPDGARLQLADHPRLDRLFPQRNRLETLVDRLERHYQAVAAAIVICLASLVAGYLWGIPWLADRIATHLPARIETALGEQVLALLDRADLEASTLAAERQAQLAERFAGLAAGLPDSANYRLLFRSAPSIGPNALALPGGTVIVTDELVELFGDDRQLDAVIAHELGHQEQRHALRQALRSSFVAIAAAFFAGDVSSASAVVVAVPTVLLQSRYSRQFEDEADRFAHAHLAALGVSPSWFAAALQTLGEEVPDDAGLAWMSSHPSTQARIAAADEAGVAFVAAHPERAGEEPAVVLLDDADVATDEACLTCAACREDAGCAGDADCTDCDDCVPCDDADCAECAACREDAGCADGEDCTDCGDCTPCEDVDCAGCAACREEAGCADGEDCVDCDDCAPCDDAENTCKDATLPAGT
ncbi:M48 family metallopeptidase [Dokdonella koreensis]|uniref:Peptidase M48 n=1 Tax=Dokdonella koreensis DS-123 TaxID=1300342 RepID=A0A161HRF8_9GAMM|nr:M48 family metallopeptidase [Dokdonella koreensis]ANB18522.1 Peptidase M48 [Dokdonella koreensis DS-123]